MAYQDAWIRGNVKGRGDRACEDRYALIRSVVTEYARPVTVWDFGANLGYFGCRLADEFGVVSVMVESRPDLVGICEANGIPTTIAMRHRLTVRDLRELSASEHADVVLALNVLHHIEDWRSALKAIVDLGERIVIETPGRGDINSANYERAMSLLDAIEALEPTLIGTNPSHVTPGVQRPMYLFRRSKERLLSGYCYREQVRARGAHPPRVHQIVSTQDEKSITFGDGESRTWFAGMNLWNWCQLGGAYPSRAAVQASVAKAVKKLDRAHGDVRPWNLILQGHDVKVIDVGHRRSRNDTEALAETLAWIETPAGAYVGAA